MFQQQFEKALEAALINEFSADWPSEVKKVPTDWLHDRLKEWGFGGCTIDKIANKDFAPGNRILMAWANHRAKQILETAEKMVCEKLVSWLDTEKQPASIEEAVNKSVLAAIGGLKGEIFQSLDTANREREHLTLRVNNAEAKVETLRNTTGAWNFTGRLNSIDLAKQEQDLTIKQLTANLTDSLKALTMLRAEHADLKAQVERLQKKVWPRGVPAGKPRGGSPPVKRADKKK